MAKKFHPKGITAGGNAVCDKYGVEFMREIGQKGGAAMKRKIADSGKDVSAYYTLIGKRGGEATKAKHGADHYAEIGRKGGTNGRGGKKPGAGRKPRALQELHESGPDRMNMITTSGGIISVPTVADPDMGHRAAAYHVDGEVPGWVAPYHASRS